MSVLNPNTATGTLGFSDLDNQARFKTSTSSMGLSSGGFTGSKDIISNMGGGIPITGGNSGDASSTTHAAVSDGTITIRDTDKQQQNVTDLSRDVEHANNALSPIFDKEKEQNRLREINLIGDIGNQVADIARTQGKIAEEKALKDPKAIQAAKDALAENGNLTPTNKQLVEQIRNTASASYGTGSDLQRAIQAATAITQGLTGGNLGQALAGGSAPYLAHEISKYLPADQSLGANLMAHAVLGAVVGHFSGNAAVGAVSAFTAEAAAPAIIKAMGCDKDSLTEKQKQTVSALATLAAGLAGGLVGDSSSSAVAGAQAGKNAVENNSLSGDHGRESMKQAAESLKNQIRDKLGEGTTSSIANAIITALADTGDTALGGGDYALDYVIALASCATGDSYCTQALNDLAGKNQAAADTVKALIQSETWSAIAESAKKAYDGDQMALEATGGMLAGLFLPGKKMPHVPNAGAVGNMAEFFKKTGFGSEIKEISKKTSKLYQGQSVYLANKPVGDYIQKGDQFYLDAKHKDHIEVFDSTGTKVRAVLNLDGSFNDAKTKAAKAEGRRLPK
ncbi:VENN motif pre-toxin domain-containing protein [Yersinia enterocolitica]|nr:VENN motif pre-toxin domain-containing protein [Yersinia enterocolitica]HDV7150321.1 VENN motif pre-toxin domain-containing protein [Yersinia enterocolitica]HED5572101.1 VENN motif pre-toxin domain-containing protein [Yersinia enterocolitica]